MLYLKCSVMKEKKMIYCKLESKNENVVIYKYGNSLNAMNNLLRIPTKDISKYSIIHSNNEDYSRMYIKKVLVKYIEKLKKGDYPETMTYISH